MAGYRSDPKDLILKCISAIVGASVLPAVYFSSSELTQLKSPAELADDGMQICWFALLFLVSQVLARVLLNPIGRTVIPRRPSWSREVWIAKVDRFSVAVFKLVCNFVAVGGLYYVVWDASWLPAALGGYGDTLRCWVDPSPLSPVVKLFYLSSVGFVLSDIMVHIIAERGRPDFAELILHLIVTFILLTVSYVASFTRLGLLVIMSHLICDIFVYTAKSLVDTKLSGGAFAYIPLLFVHVWFRLFIFATTILRSILVEAPRNIGGLTSLWAYVSTMIALSLLLHTYWGFVIFKIGLLLLTTGQSRDLQANLSSMDVRLLGEDSNNGSSASLSEKKVL